jgi:hypothetical protein
METTSVTTDPNEPIGPSTPVPEPTLQAQPPAPSAPPPAKRSRRRTLAIVSGAVAILLVLLGVGGAIANASLSTTYGASRAVTDYFAAMARGDVHYMLANANYPKGAGSPEAMMALDQNRTITNVRVTAATDLDSNTSRVSVSLSWAGKPTSQTYVLHKDPSRKHYLLYSSWRIDIPSSTITVQLPPQGGPVGIDGVYGSSLSTIQVIQGYHAVSTQETALYDLATQVVDATGDSVLVNFSSMQLSASAVASAAGAIRNSFLPQNITCDARTYFDCPNHKYAPAPGTYAILELPGGNISAYQSWILTITGDPTKDMKLVVGDSAGKITASGTCTMQLLVDGNKTYTYHGTWQGTITVTGSDFAYDGSFVCDEARG